MQKYFAIFCLSEDEKLHLNIRNIGILDSLQSILPSQPNIQIYQLERLNCVQLKSTWKDVPSPVPFSGPPWARESKSACIRHNMRGGKLPFCLHLYKEVCICDHRLKTDVIVALHLFVHVKVGRGAVTFIKTLKLPEVTNQLTVSHITYPDQQCRVASGWQNWRCFAPLERFLQWCKVVQNRWNI